MSGLTPLIPEKKLMQLVKERMAELNLSGREIAGKLKIPQSLIARSLSGKRSLRYEELQRLVEYVLSVESLVQMDIKAIDIAVPYEKIVWVDKEASVGTVASLMEKGGYSQIPVKGEDKEDFEGVVTDLGILKTMIDPKRAKVVALDELRDSSVDEADLLEPIADCPPGVSLNIVAQLLVHFPTLLLKDDLGNIKGLITRADMLRLLTEPLTEPA